MKQHLNFSPQPFRIRSPILVVLWLANLLLAVGLAYSVYHWWGLHNQNRTTHQAIDELEGRQRTIVKVNQALITDLEGVDLKSYRQKIRQFHDIQTAVNTHWGKLLDDLGRIQPEDVRITSLKPSYGSLSSGRRGETVLRLAGEARNKEAQLEFIQALQGHAAFGKVSFENEAYDLDQVSLSFEVSFTYRAAGS